MSSLLYEGQVSQCTLSKSCLNHGVAGCWCSRCHAELPRRVCGPGALKRFSWECEHRVNNEIDGLSVSVLPLSCTGLMRALLFCCMLALELQGDDSTSEISEVTLSSVGPQPPAPRLGIPVTGVIYITVHFTWASNGHSAQHFMCATIGSTVVLGSVSPLILRILVWHLPVTAWRSVPCLALTATCRVR